MVRPAARHLLPLLLFCGVCPAADIVGDTYHVGAAKVDVTPKKPIRLNGFGGRRAESEGVAHPIHVRAMSIRHSADTVPVVVVTADVLGFPDTLRREIETRVADAAKVPPERLALFATHTHCGPMLKGANPTLFGVPIPEDHLKHIDEYTAMFVDGVVRAVAESVKTTTACKLSFGIGSVGFAANRRNGSGPTDHDLPVLVARDAKTGEVRAIHTSYACHCVTLSHNKLGGDWAGYAAEAIEDRFPNAVGLVSIGCGADQNPNSGVTGDKVEVATVQGRSIASEVKRLIGGYLVPVRGKPACQMKALDLPLAAHPEKMGWEELAKRPDAIGHHARVQLDKLAKQVTLPTSVPYPVQTWSFGDSLALVHLPGEVVVDYALRLKKELDRTRVWITAYANTNPCYIPSERILKEGGYEGGGAMVYYDLPTPFRPGLEDKIVGEVRTQLGKTFDTPLDRTKNVGDGPLPAQRSASRIRTDARFAVELVAAEPLVASPVAIAFGPDGKLWVAEMIDYPNGKTGKFEPGGRVRFLEDIDGDGTFDKATTFLDNIPFPTGLLPWRKGVLVCTAPDVLYAADTDGDGKADKVEKLLAGFGTGNYQARVNGLAYGLDGWVHASCGLFGGEIRSGKTGKVFALGDRDFRFKPDTGEIEPVTGRTQQGRVRDDWGSWFGCDNSNLGWHYLLDDADLRRNPHVAPPGLVSSLVTTSDGNQLFPVGNPQMFKLSGPVGRPTAACGIGLLRDDRLGADLRGNAFTCEPVNNLVHRMALEPRGVTFAGVRPAEEKAREFLASDDRWFRPVQATTGPDGALWVVDMYRFVIEHPRWIPEPDLATVDVRAGSTLGRIYRVRRADTKPTALPRLDKLDTAGLVAALDSANGWQRDVATELLAWNADPTAVPHLRRLLRESNRSEARLHALVALERLKATAEADLLVALTDSHPGVRGWAYRAAAGRAGDDSRVSRALREAVGEADPRARLHLAASLADCKDSGPVLARLVGANLDDRHLIAVVVSSLNKANFSTFVSQPAITAALRSPLLGSLIATAVGLGDEASFAALLRSACQPQPKGYEAWQYAALEATLAATARAKSPFALPDEAKTLLATARQTALKEGAEAALRIACVRLLAANREKPKELIDDLASLLSPRQPDSLQNAALAALGRMDDGRAAAALLAAWGGLSPANQNAAVASLLARDSRLNAVFDAIAAGKLPGAAVSAGERQRLLTHANPAVRKRAEAAFAGATNRDRQQVIDRYRTDTSKGDPARGRAVFVKSCAACHKLDGVGQAVGPDLAGIANKTREYLLAEILDPNRNLDNRYVEYRAASADGRTLTGVLAAESSTSVTLRGADGKETTLLRADIESLKSTGRSLMPDGLEKDVSPAAMADLLAFLGATTRAAKVLPGNAPKLVKAVDGVLTLKAADAEIFGAAITFETDFGNVGYWHGVDDHVRWRIELPDAGKFDVYLDAACDPISAGNAFAIDGGEPTLRGKTASTGAWANYRWTKLGSVSLPKGESRITMRPDTPTLKAALIDLRSVTLVPAGRMPPFKVEGEVKQPAVPDTPVGIGRALIDDNRPTAEREALVAKLAGRSAAALAEMTRGIADAKDEYRRIPWVWRVAIAAGTRNDAAEIAAVLAVSLPKAGEPLRDWQAVVIGGGIVNGLSLSGPFPAPHLAAILKDNPALADRWTHALAVSLKMADDEKVPTGTRYDALRMLPLLGPDAALKPLTKYLAKGTNAELQMGAVSGLADLESTEATALLVAALGHLTGGNRVLAFQALTRTDERATALLDAVAGGKLLAKDIDPAVRKSLRESKSETVRRRAVAVFGPAGG